MIEMSQTGPLLPPVVAFAGSAAAVVGGTLAVASPDASTGTAGLYVGVGGILMGAATLLGVLGDKFMPHMITLARIHVENREENRKNREARHALAEKLNAAVLEMEVMKQDLIAARKQANDSENLAIEAATKLAMVEKQTQERIKVVEKGVRSNADRIEAVESQSGSGDVFPAQVSPPGTPS